MIEKSELVLFLLSLGVLFFLIGNTSRFKKIPSSNILIAGFLVFFTGWVFTILEGFFWGTFLNIIEHICYIAGLVLVAVWCWKMFGRKEIR
ncbi:MAG: hypothetical protein KJ887_02375 [Candidatus Omnitrophica bacterium]|nr:hypothetical protein [Candidatus Omnitrophota bacterium]MBU1047909.1 hypothetical protein [Candidatus Omnitrophota bacterium]MBU1631474.1 hypothetical protein [Candidatus Omnitrophota bacterium]MBU1888532.1 hypothetical protein [Candidatus Omnitrophota bacterium]